MTELFTLKHRLIRHGLSFDWLLDQFRRRRCGVTLRELQDVYAGEKTDDTAEPIIRQALSIIDDYDAWLAGVSA